MPPRLPSYSTANIIWLLRVDFGGTPHFVSTETVAIERDDGTYASYTGGLTEPDYSETLSRFTYTKDPLTIAIEAVFDNLDIAKHRREGFFLCNATCELSIVFEVGGVIQQKYEERIRLLSGLMSEPIYGQPDRPVGYVIFSIDSNPFDQTGPFFKSTMRMNSSSMQGFVNVANPMSEESEDKVYPLVFGTPGMYADINQTETSVQGSPAYAISRTNISLEARELLIAGHHVNAGTVKVFSQDVGSVTGVSVVNSFDLYRNPIAYVDITAQSSAFQKATEFWIAWNDGSAAENPFASSNVVNGAGDLMLWALTQADFKVDHGAWAAARDYLNAYRFSGYLNDPEVTIWEWITEISKFIPTLTIQNSPEGIYPIVQDMRSTIVDCLAITSGPDFSREGGVSLEGEQSDVVNTVTVDFAYEGESNTPKMYSVLGDIDLSEPQRFSTIHSAISLSRYGVKEEVISAPYVYDKSTAELIAEARVQMHGQIPETVEYRADTYYSFLALGDQVKLTDSDLYLSDQICTVCGKSWGGDAWLIKLLIEDDVARDIRHV